MTLPSEVDYIVVGGGSAGCVLANRLSEDRANSVLLVEAGGDDRPTRNLSGFIAYSTIHIPAGYARLLHDKRFDWSDHTEIDISAGNRRHRWSRGRVLGGGSSINGSIYIRGQPQDYDYWHSLGCTGWSAQEVLPFFRKCEDQERGESDWHGVGGPLTVSNISETHVVSDALILAAHEAGLPLNEDFNGATQEGAGYFQLTQRSGRRCSTSRAYLNPARARNNLAIAIDTLVDRVLIERRRAVGVVTRRAGVTQTIKARREVILSSGAVGSPQLLQLSGVGPADLLKTKGVEVIFDSPGVGENLQDHYTAALMWRLKPGTPSANELSHGAKFYRELAKFIFQRRGLLTLSPGNVGIFCKSTPEIENPDIQFVAFPATPDITKASQDKIVLEEKPGLTAAFNVLRPRSRGSVRIASRDPDAAPAVTANYLADPSDQFVIVQGARWARKFAMQPSLARLIDHEFLPGPSADTDERLLAFCRNGGSTGYHPVGTCAMGRGKSAVLDPELRVNGIEGLRVIDASVMPTITSGNTNAPTIMIAEKGAEMIRAGSKSARAVA